MMADVGEVGSGSAVARAVDHPLAGENRPAETPLPVSVGQGSAIGGGSQLPAVPKQPTQKANGPTAAQAAAQISIDFLKIDACYHRLVEATKNFQRASDILDEDQISTEKNTAFSQAARELSGADLQFRKAINDQTAVRAGPSPISPGKGHGGQIRELEVRIVLAYTRQPHEQSWVSDAIFMNREARLPLELIDLSNAVKTYNGEFSPAQRAEANDIIADASSWVVDQSPSDGFDAAQLKNEQFNRLDKLLDDISKTDRNFDAGVFDKLIAQIRKPMDISDKFDLKKFNSIVAGYRERLGIK